MLGLAHRLGPARDDKPCGARGDLHRRVEHRLQPRAAPAVDLHTWDVHAKAGVQRRDPADRRGLAVRVALAEHHVVHVALAQADARAQRAEHGGGEVGRRQPAEHAAESADW